MRPVTAAVLATGLAGLLVLAGAGGVWLLAAAVLLVQAVLAYGWFSVVPVPDTASSTLLVGAAGLAADVVLFTDDRLRAEDADPSLAPLASVLGLLFLAALVSQLARRDGRVALTSSLAATVTGGALTVFVAAWLPTLQSRGAFVGSAAALAGAAVASALAALPGRRGLLAALAAALAAVVGALIGSSEDVVGAAAGAGLGLGAGVASVLAVVAVDFLASAPAGSWLAPPAAAPVSSAPASGSAPAGATPAGTVAAGSTPTEGRLAAAAALPFALAGPVAYVVGRLLVG